jgi:hypothetical protein
MYSNNDQAICYACGKVCKDHNDLWNHIQSAHGNSRTDDTRGGGGPRGIIAIIAAIIFTASLFVSPVAKAQEPQPTPSIGAPVKALNLVYLPLISFPAEVHGCDDCQAVSWRPTGS